LKKKVDPTIFSGLQNLMIDVKNKNAYSMGSNGHKYKLVESKDCVRDRGSDALKYLGTEMVL